MKKNITEKYGPLTDEQYQLILASIPPAAFIPGIGGFIVIGGSGPVVGGLIGGILTGPVIPIIGTSIGIGLLIKWHKDRKAKNNEQIGNNRNNNNSNNNNSNNDNNNNDKDPKDPEDHKDPKNLKYKRDNGEKSLYPNGKYVNNPKHHKNSKNGIGKPPIDGQKALNESIEVPGKKYRIGIENKKIIQFPQHCPNEYHGYIVENYHELDGAAQKALSKAGLVNSKSGKIK